MRRRDFIRSLIGLPLLTLPLVDESERDVGECVDTFMEEDSSGPLYTFCGDFPESVLVTIPAKGEYIVYPFP